MIGRDFSKNGLFSSYHEKEYTLRLQVSVAETRGDETRRVFADTIVSRHPRIARTMHGLDGYHDARTGQDRHV